MRKYATRILGSALLASVLTGAVYALVAHQERLDEGREFGIRHVSAGKIMGEWASLKAPTHEGHVYWYFTDARTKKAVRLVIAGGDLQIWERDRSAGLQPEANP